MGAARRRRLMGLEEQNGRLPEPRTKVSIWIEDTLLAACQVEYDALVSYNAAKDPPQKTPELTAIMPQWIEFGLKMAKHLRDPALVAAPPGKLIVSPYA